ncbi:cytidine deaminase [Thermanaerovibrio acidaminovorans DSM 6589]|uniref:Cytidine deaminase n=2 Tax=Thermanaerovibrio TaxID=81461 RepID=D1B5K6_THEAS|nr:cytidine deaminase [Thermanaerovibrio acidaminovorans]ACZ19297.1 cytidine deaminase [Thermanaerovibrio acidaminovorans DSM 6589]
MINLTEEELDRLWELALKARGRAYSGYSGFSVGAALLCDDRKVFLGCNVENSSYGLTQCAERSAICSMVAAGSSKPVAIAVRGPEDVDCSPCGACRQVLMEHNPDMLVLFQWGGQRVEVRCRELLPYGFELKERD